jgi:penicillin-binding protein 2
VYRLLVIGFLLLVLIVGCTPSASPSVEVLPTVASLPSTPEHTLVGAERVARAFLDAWSEGDFAAMYDLTAFASREAVTLESFTSVYEASQNEMTLQSLTYEAIALNREREDVAVFSYDVTFTTHILGEFSDPNRNLHLVVDPETDDWRVAWSPADIFAEMANGARLRLERIIPSRANIYDRDGEILADQNGSVVTVNVIKQDIPQYDTCIAILSEALGKPIPEILAKLDESAPDWLTEVGTIEPAVYVAMNARLEEVCDTQFNSRATRRYLQGTLAPHIIGYVGYPDEAGVPAVQAAGFDRDSILGRSGIEASWDETLRGSPGGRLVIVTPVGEVLRQVAQSSSQPSESVWLTLDSDLQAHALQIVSDAYRAAADGWASESKGAAAVVMDVQTGAILAMVSYPTYDGNVFTAFPPRGREVAQQMLLEIQEDERVPQLNRVTQGLYPLGSVMKLVSSTAVADTGVYELDHSYTCTGIWNRDITRFDWRQGGHGTVTLSQAITQSCNPYFYEVGYNLNESNPEALPAYAHMMGLGQPTGFTDLPEAPGLIPNPEWKRTVLGLDWSFSDAVNISIGQGEVSVTPLQVVRMTAALANGGTLYRPQLVQQVGILGETPSYTVSPVPMSEIDIQTDVLNLVRDAMCAVTTSETGTAEYQFQNSELQTIGVCGKTGTAQDGSRADALSHAWFTAYAPANDPEIAIVVLVENSGEGSAIAAPIARDILEYYFFEMR